MAEVVKFYCLYIFIISVSVYSQTRVITETAVTQKMTSQT